MQNVIFNENAHIAVQLNFLNEKKIKEQSKTERTLNT